MTADYETLESVIVARYTHLMADHINTVGLERITAFAKAFAQWVDFAMIKYEAGQREHGGWITDRDILHELAGEIPDLVFYFIAHKTRHPVLEVNI